MDNKDINKIFSRFMIRAAIAVVVVVPISLLYDTALTSLNEEQMATQLRVLAVLVPIAVLLFWALTRLHFSPVARVIAKIRAGEDVDEMENIKAQRRALLMPFITGFYAMFLFIVTSLFVNGTLYTRAGVSFEMLVYLLISMVTTATMMGIASAFLARRPLREALLYIMERRPTGLLRPPLFVPISIKITSLFVIIITLFLVFSGLLSSVIIKRMLTAERHGSIKSEITTVATALGSMAESGGVLDENLVTRFGSSDNVYVLADGNLNIIGSPQVTPSSGVLQHLSTIPENTIYQDIEGDWDWIKTSMAGGHILLHGRRSIQVTDIIDVLRKYYLVSAVVALLVGVFVGFLIARDISTTLRELSETALDIAGGATGTRIIPGSEDETGILARAFNRMGNILLSQLRVELQRSRTMIDSIVAAVQTLAPLSRDLLSIAEDQATSSVEQATAAEEAATTGAEIVAVAKQIAETAAEVSDRAARIQEITHDGQTRLDLTARQFNNIDVKVDDIAKAVLKLGEMSQEIGAVVEIISEVSEQTNLLALNASIEAAGAGEYGRRFEVVAHEIRRLAQSTAQSVGKIQNTIERMQKAVSASIMMAEEGGKAVIEGMKVMRELESLFTALFDENNSTTPRLREIGLMTSQQATASEQMNNTIEEIKETATNSSDSATRIQALMQKLDALISQLQAHVEEKQTSEPER